MAKISVIQNLILLLTIRLKVNRTSRKNVRYPKAARVWPLEKIKSPISGENMANVIAKGQT